MSPGNDQAEVNLGGLTRRFFVRSQAHSRASQVFTSVSSPEKENEKGTEERLQVHQCLKENRENVLSKRSEKEQWERQKETSEITDSPKHKAESFKKGVYAEPHLPEEPVREGLRHCGWLLCGH